MDFKTKLSSIYLAVRRRFLVRFRGKYVVESLMDRKGECKQHPCCDTRGMFRKEKKCREQMPFICKIYPIDEKDKNFFSKKYCGYYWDETEQNPVMPSGVLDQSYAQGRKTKVSWRYRLKRRTDEVLKTLDLAKKKERILDIGAAEGAMLNMIKERYPQSQCVGLEYSKELIALNSNSDIQIIQGDAQNLPFENNSFDVAIAMAIIEHLNKPKQLVAEARRVIKKGGLLILSTPDPFFDKIARLISRDCEGHNQTLNLRQLKNLFEQSGFRVLRAEKFMPSPFGLPLESKIEKIIKFARLNFLLLNQLIVGEKK